jgi:hypothetical protein
LANPVPDTIAREMNERPARWLAKPIAGDAAIRHAVQGGAGGGSGISPYRAERDVEVRW